jgi:iron complex transport system ATP-binding protein
VGGIIVAVVATHQLAVSYGELEIFNGLNLSIPKGKITAIVGPNGCGKSTVLKTIARILQPKTGVVYLNGKAIHTQPTKEVARQMAILPQTPEAPDGLTVAELVSYGRFPHQRGFGRLTSEDRRIIQWALKVTGMSEYGERPIEALSGGQRQRVWIAMALAQGTDLLLLDEPTTYLDLAHQLEVLQLLERLNREEQRTIVMVIHDLNHAARFAHRMVAFHQGKIIKEGTPAEVMTPEVLREVFQIEASIVQDPKSGKPVCLTYELFRENQNKNDGEKDVVSVK